MNSGERLGNLLPTFCRLASAQCLAVPGAFAKNFLVALLCPGIFKPPLTCAVVRERPRMLALTLLIAQSTLLSSFARIGGPREIQSTRENWRTTVTSQSIRSQSRRTQHDAVRPAAHLHDWRCMRSNRLGTHEALRVDRSWAYRHDHDRTSAT